MLNPPLIAIDIGSSSIKVIELVGGSQKRLRSIGLEVLPSGAVVDGQILDAEAVTAVLKDLLKKLKIMPFGRRAAIGLSGSSVLIKKINVDLKDKTTDVSESVFYEAEQHFQLEMSEVYFDYIKLADPSEKNQQTSFLMVGAKRDVVENFVGVVRACGMRCGVIDCNVFAAANMLEYSFGPMDSLSALINVGASVTQVILINKGQFVYSRELPMGGDEYSRRIMELLSVDHMNAETLKLGASSGNENAIPELNSLLIEINDQIVHEIQVAIDYYLQTGEDLAGTNISSVFLTGGSSRVLGLDAALAAALQIPVRIINPFQNIAVNSSKFQMDYLLMQGHLYGIAVGLGIRKMSDHIR